MRVSEHFHLKRTQPTLDFVDVNINGDVRVFVDPRALRCLPSKWGATCVYLVQNFFRSVLEAIRKKEHDRARGLLRVLREPNETHLGLSIGRARGRGLGNESAGDVWGALSESAALRSGLLEDLEDTILMIEGVSSDIISDMTTNIIRGPLIEYTARIAPLYGIPLADDVNSGPVWNPEKTTWESGYVRLPMTNEGKLLLIPKAIVRQKMDYDVDEYYRHYLLEHLQEVELNANSELVQLLKQGGRRVTKKDVMEKYGIGKRVIVRETQRFPEVLARYRDDKRKMVPPPLGHTALALADGTNLPDWDRILQELRDIQTGRDDATEYERCVEQVLTSLFYPSLTNPDMQTPLHNGRKRVDITYTNMATEGFFRWLSAHYSAANIFVECKNYSADPANPELDQLSGRFGTSRGQIGILVARSINDKALFLERCRDTALDERGFIVFLDDEDLAALIDEKKKFGDQAKFQILWDRFKAITL